MDAAVAQTATQGRVGIEQAGPPNDNSHSIMSSQGVSHPERVQVRLPSSRYGIEPSRGRWAACPPSGDLMLFCSYFRARALSHCPAPGSCYRAAMTSQNSSEASPTQEMRSCIAIRLTDRDGIDPIKEVRDVIAEKGYCWFAKFGRAIGSNSVEPGKTLLCIIQGRPNSRKTAFFLIETMSKKSPTVGECPSYYWNMYGKKLWIKVRDFEAAEQIKLEDVISNRSQKKLITVMPTTMTGHFVCTVPLYD